MNRLLRFDTRDTKPKLWILIPLSVLAAAAVTALLAADPHGFGAYACFTVAAYGLTVTGALIWAFREQIRYNPYSYNTIIYFGFALFLIFVTVTYAVIGTQFICAPEGQSGISVIFSLLGSAKDYMYLTSPFILVFSVALCVSNIALMRHEGRRPVNILGIILSFLLIAGIVFIFTFDYEASGSQWEVMIHDMVTNLIAAVYLYFECMLIGTIVAGAMAALFDPPKDKDYIIILGCGLKKDGTPTPLLRGRIERAIAFAAEQEAETGKKAFFVTSGGKGSDEPVSECAAMKAYLLERGIPEERIIEEDRSRDTYENMRFSWDKIKERDPSAKVAFSTTNYHVFRSGVFARRVKMRAQGMSSKTKWYFWPNAAVREFVGLLTKHRLKQALILGGMVIFYVVMTFISYQ